MNVSQRGNNNMAELMVSHGAPDATEFMQARKAIMQRRKEGETIPLDERKKFVPLRAPQQIKESAPTLDVSDLPIKRKTFKVEFTGTLAQWQKCGEEGVSWEVPEANHRIFQDVGADNAPEGNLSKVIPIQASTSNHKSTLPFDTCTKIPGMQGNIFMKNGIQTAVHIPAAASGLDNTRVECHKLDSQQMRLTELHLTSISEDVLKQEWIQLPREEGEDVDFCLVKRGGEITRVLTRPKNLEKLGINLDSYELVKNNNWYFMEKDLVDLCVDSILTKAKDVKVPYVNHFKWPITLIKEDGGAWSEVDCDPTVTSLGETISAHVLKKHHTVSFMLHYDYVIASGAAWERSVTRM
jgi:hypothetical protein